MMGDKDVQTECQVEYLNRKIETGGLIEDQQLQLNIITNEEFREDLEQACEELNVV